MLANGRSRPPPFTDPGTPNISSGEGATSSYKFAQTAGNYPGGRKRSDDGIEPLNARDHEILQELEEFMSEGPSQPGFPNNNNNTGVWSTKMAASNTNRPNQQLTNTNGFQLPLGTGSSLPNKQGGGSMNLPSFSMNNQLMDQVSSNVHSSNLGHANQTPSSLKMLPGAPSNPGLPQTNQFNQYSQQQDALVRGFPGSSRASPHDIASNSILRGEQYGSPRSFMSATNESQIRGLNRQTPSPFSQNYFPQDTHNAQSSNRTGNSKSDERSSSSNEHYQWPQNRFQPSSLCPPASASNVSSPVQQSMPPRRPPYIPVGQGHYPMPQQPQGPQPNPFIMGPGMKPSPLQQPQPPYYNSMGMQGMMGNSQIPIGGRGPQSAMGSQMQPPQQEYGSYQQSFHQRYPQPNYPPQLASFMSSRQPPQGIGPGPGGMPRMQMPQHHQPILPKPSADMFGPSSSASRYPNSMQDSAMDFPGQMMSDQQLHRQQSYASPGGVGPGSDGTGRQPISQGQYQRAFPPFPSPLHSGSSSPNVTLGSPLRSMNEGFPGRTPPPSSGPGAPPAYPSTSNPPSSFPGDGPSNTGAAAAAAAALAAASSMSSYPGLGPQSVDPGRPPSYSSTTQDNLVGSRPAMGVVPSPRSGTPTLPGAALAGTEGSSPMNSVETGRVSSPSLNQLPTAEDVEKMISMMGSSSGCLNTSQVSSQSSTPTSAAPTSTSQAPNQATVPSVEAEQASDVNSMNDSQATLESSPAQVQATAPTSTADSPLSSFAGLSSPSSSFGNDQEELDIPVDSITPTFTEASSSSFPDQPRPSVQYAKFSQLYDVDDSLERKVFLDKYSAFMESSGSPVAQVPLVNTKPLDLFKFYKVVREAGGLQEVVKKKAWDHITMRLEVPSHLIYTLRTQYARFLLSYEMKDSHGASVDNILKNELEDAGIPPPNAMVTCTEAIIPSPAITTSQSGESMGYSHVNGPQFAAQGYKGEGYKGEGYPEMPSMNDAVEPRPSVPQMPNVGSYNVPPYMMGSERSGYSSYPNRSYSQFKGSQYSGATALSQVMNQRSQPGVSGYPAPPPQGGMVRRPSMMGPQQAHHMMSSPSPQEQIPPVWPGAQYNASSEPGQMFDYHPNQPSRGMRPTQQQYPAAPSYNPYQSRQQQPQYPSLPPQYRSTTSPHVPPSSATSLSRPPQTPTQQQSQHPPQQMSPKPKFTAASAHPMKREITFPQDSVECTKPVFTKKRKLTSRDLGPVEAWRVMMSLKSGLLSETTWALDTLNILLYDENTVGYFVLSHLPGLLDNLLDHFRRYLVDIFGAFLDTEIATGAAFIHKELKGKTSPDEEKTTDEKLEEDVCRSLTAFIASASIDYPDEGFVSRSRMWARGTSDTTTHIQSHIGTATADTKQVTKRERGVKTEDDRGSFKGGCCDVKKESEASCMGDIDEPNEIPKDEYVEPLVKENVKIEENEKSSCESKCCGEKGNGHVKLENCVANSVGQEWDLDSDSDSDLSSEKDSENSEPHKNDSCLPRKESLTTRLKRELDLLIDVSSDDEETDSYIKSVIQSKIQQDRDSVAEEQECHRREDAPLCLRTESDDALSRRCICVSNILRGLSFVPSNDIVMYKHGGLLFILGRLLLLYHEHAGRVSFKRTYMQEDCDHELSLDNRDGGWWHCLEVLRENTLVILSNIAGQLDLTFYADTIRDPIVDGLLHWLVCESADALDPMPTATAATSLSAQQLVLEALAKMSILGGNADLILSSPPTSRLHKLHATLVRLLGCRSNPVTRELALVLLSNLSQTDSDFINLGDKKQCISMLLQFIEDAANAINAYSSTGALAQAGFHSEDFCGTSVDMLRRAATTLVCLARGKSNRALFLPFQERLLLLTTLRLLDGMIGSHLADVLYYLSR